MAFQPVPDTVQANIHMTCHGQTVENTLTFQHSGGWNAASAHTLANDLLVWWTTLFSLPLSQDLALVEIVVTDLSTEGGFQVTQPAPAPAPKGQVGVPSEPNNVALCVSFRTARIGRSYRGRNYVGGIPTTKVTGDFVDGGTQASILSAYGTLSFSITSSGGVWVVVSRRNNKTLRPVGVTTPIVDVVIVDSAIDSQRRRLPGRGI